MYTLTYGRIKLNIISLIRCMYSAIAYNFSLYFQPHNKKVSCCIYLAGLAVTDNLFMVNCFELSLYMGLLADDFTDNHCKFAAYYFQV